MQHVKNIIFDLGGVIINLDYGRSINEFNQISAYPFENIFTQNEQTELFDRFDKGLIAEHAFFKELKSRIRYQGDEAELVPAWNAMLLGVPENRLDLLVTAKQNYNTFLLSNTNETHIAAFEKDLYHTHGVRNFQDYFDKVYYSCRMGMRKPDREIFEYVLSKNKLKPEETIFIDDSVEHVKSAGECGINAYLLQPNMEIGTLLKELKLL